ncbi:hypothetical protein HaLaN_19911, partial [Haematococcus lacustris]
MSKCATQGKGAKLTVVVVRVGRHIGSPNLYCRCIRGVDQWRRIVRQPAQFTSLATLAKPKLSVASASKGNEQPSFGRGAFLCLQCLRVEKYNVAPQRSRWKSRRVLAALRRWTSAKLGMRRL